MTAANVSEKQGFMNLFNKKCLPTVEKIWADTGYSGYPLKCFASNISKDLEIVKRTDIKNSKIQPHRWIVERTLGWLGRYRRLSKDYEGLPKTSEAWIHLSMVRLMLRRIDL